MSDGDRLRRLWSNALNEAESLSRRLLTSHSSPEWKRVVTGGDNSSSGPKGKARLAATLPELSDVVLHRRSGKSGNDVYRVTLDVPTGEEVVSLEPWKAVIATPELRQEWDPAVEAAHLVEMFDNKTRICKTKFTLGWPANPRDAVTISRSFCDATTIIDISTSLPRSLDEPAYLRPSPPYVRSNITLFAWCIQHVPAQQQPLSEGQPKRKMSNTGRIRVTCFWQHDLRALWNFGSSSGLSQQLCTMVLGFLKTVKKRGSRVPMLTGYGNGVAIERIRFQIDREALTIDYAIVPEDDVHANLSTEGTQGLEELNAVRELRRLTRSMEYTLPSSEGWDIQLSTKASSKEVEQLPWSSHAIRSSSSPSSSTTTELDQVIVKVTHASLLDDHSILKVKVVIELSGPSSGLRLNGLPHVIHDVEEERDPTSYTMSQQILQDVSSTADLSFRSVSSIKTSNSTASSSSKSPVGTRTPAERAAAAEKSVLSRVRRNYIYFSSLLQEPEAKWKRTTEARGVSITQLDSIDPTLVVYRAEATFVGVGLWDLYGALVSPGARAYWDKQHDDGILLEDVNELTELWHFKTKPAWPVNGRDSVVLKTVYKSPTTIHVFSFSADEPGLFPNIPVVEPNVIRTQVDLQGWAIESLSPTTSLLTLLEQSDPKGWSNKASIPQQMINAVAGVGEFAIKCGGPPVVTRLAGAKANEVRYDHERGSFKIEYEGSPGRRTPSPSDTNTEGASNAMQMPVIECELRCDVDTWASSLDIVVDPPPQSITCLRRHRLSSGGGGLWLTMTHDAIFVDDERLLAIVRKGPNILKEKGLVMLNGAKVIVDVEELAEQEIKALTKQKRIKPVRIPLDQPPVVGVIRRRRAEWDADTEPQDATPAAESPTVGPSSAPRFPSPLTRFFTTAVEQAASSTQQAVAAVSPTTAAQDGFALTSSKSPMQYALEALSWIQDAHPRFSSQDWTLLSEKGLTIHRKLLPEISPSIPVHRGEKVVEGVSAEELAAIVTQNDCRKQWDDRFESSDVFEAFGADAYTSFMVSKGGFPFRGRGFYLASLVARAQAYPISRRNTGEVEQVNGSRNAIYCVSASFSPDSVAAFSATKYNPNALPTGRVFIDGWIFETLDPYTTENYAIPSTRCTRMVAVDYAGSVPAAVNSMINATLPRSILAIETYVKNISPLPITRLPVPGMLISDKKTDPPFTNTSWKLRRRDENRVLVTTKYIPEECMYRSTVILTMPSFTGRSPTLSMEATTPRPSLLTLTAQPSAMSEGTPVSTNDVSSPPSLASPLLRRRRTSSSSPPRRTSPTPPHVTTPGPSRDVLKPSTSAFTLRGEIRPSTDLLVAEVVVDSKLYPRGYNVQLRSRIRDGTKKMPLISPEDDLDALPIAYTVHTMPSSPLHSSGLNADRPTRHLLRMTLPTALYQISTVQDPLTGETRSAPPKPQWLLDLQEKGAIVVIEIKPSGNIKNDVTVNGKVVVVANEKESLTSLGREELQEDRISKMAVLSRSSSETEPVPDGLKVPLAVAETLLLDPSAATTTIAPGQDNKETMETSTTSDGNEAIANDHPPDPVPELQLQTNGSTRLLGFLNSYPNPLSRFASSSRVECDQPTPSLPSRRASGREKIPPGGLQDLDDLPSTAPSSIAPTQQYPLSTIIVVALIAFLCGSLLRSLLSPADFIYVATDWKEAEQPNNNGWREIKRLLEVKYIIGGWDFQIAVVRRH